MNHARSVNVESIKARLGISGTLDPFARSSMPLPLRPNVGLTGSTGWFGRHMARLLLSRDPDLYLMVPVRAESADAGLARIRKIWCPTPELALRASREHWWERTQVIPIGDMGAPWDACGLNVPTSLDAVIHSAADMSLALSLDGAWSANVQATQHAYRWAVQSGAKRFDQISTLSVFIAGSTPHGKICEDDPLERSGDLHGGYAASKWAAEAWLSTQKGLTLGVHRLGLLSYSNTDGWAPGDGLYAVALAWKKWGCPDFIDPRIAEQVDWSPVDQVAEGVHRALVSGEAGPLHWASRLAVPSTAWVRVWKHAFGASPGSWPPHDPLAKAARRALGRWSDPERAQRLWWHDVFQAEGYEFDARHSNGIYPQWSWTQSAIEDALSKI